MILHTARFRFIADALNGAGGFQPFSGRSIDGNTLVNSSSYLVQYPREGDSKYQRRNEVAWYVNDLRAACVRFIGYIAKHPPRRTLPNPLMAAIDDDADWRGNSLNVFWHNFMLEAKARGSMMLLVDMPRDLSQRSVPYLTAIYPEEVINISLDDQGMISMVEVPAGNSVRGWDAASWWIKQGGRIIEQGDHGLGVCPVLSFSEAEFPQEGEFSQIADLSRRMFNLRSELDEILRAQTFSLLTYQIPPAMEGAYDIGNIAAQIGTHNMLTHAGNTPAFIAPPDGPARVYLDVIAQVEDKIRRIGHVIESVGANESGLALTVRFQQLNSALAHWAMKMADLERRAWYLVSLWLNIPDTSDVAWESDYAITDLKTELDALASMQMAGFSDATLTAKRQRIVALSFTGLPGPELDALLESEALGIHERQPQDNPTDTMPVDMQPIDTQQAQ